MVEISISKQTVQCIVANEKTLKQAPSASQCPVNATERDKMRQLRWPSFIGSPPSDLKIQTSTGPMLTQKAKEFGRKFGH